MIKLFGNSQIIKKDELLGVVHVGNRLGDDVVYRDGKPIQIGDTSVFVRGHVQPVIGYDLMLVPEGDRFKENLYLYFNNLCIITAQGMEITTNTTLQLNDTVQRLDMNNCPTGVNYTVQSTMDWGTFTRARVTRIDTGPNKTPDPP